MKRLILPFLLASSIFANEANLEITNHSIEINTKISIPQNENFSFRGSYLYNDKTNKNNYFSAGIQAQGENALDSYNSKFAIFIDFDYTKNNSALPIGISLFNDNFGNTNYPLFAKIELAYAPSVLSFDNADKFYKIKTEIGVKPIENAKLFIGYKQTNFNTNYQAVGYIGVGFIF